MACFHVTVFNKRKFSNRIHLLVYRSRNAVFTKSVRSRDFLLFPMRVASKINRWSKAILSHDYSKWWRASKIVSEPKKNKSIWSHCGQKSYAYLMWRRVTTVIVSRRTLRFNKHMFSTIFFSCPTFQCASWRALFAKLWQQPTIFFACLFTLVRAIFIRHPMDPWD